MQNKSIPFIDLAAQQTIIRDKIDAAIARVLDHGQYILGPEVSQFEADLAAFTGAKNVVSCANGTDALSLMMMAWGIGLGDAVIVPSFTYVATAEAAAQLGATPFFVDILPDTFNMDPASFEQAVIEIRELGLRPAMVTAVDLFGQPCDIAAISAIAKRENIRVLVDGAQSFGGSLDGHRVGTMGGATTTSFFPAKPLGCYGDGGAIFTDNDELSDLLKSLRFHGMGEHKYDHVNVGLNSRLDTIQAAILIEKLKIFPAELAARQRVAERYNEALAGVAITPFEMAGTTSAWAQYTLIVEDRAAWQEKLAAAGIPSMVYYPLSLHQQQGYTRFPKLKAGLGVSETLSKQVLSLPMHPYLSEDDQDYIIQTILG